MVHLGHVGHGVLPFHERGPAFYVTGYDRGGQAHVGGEVHGRFPDLPLLGGDEDDTVLCSETVDGRRSVLQDGDALDVVRVQFLEDGEVRIGLQGVRIGVVGGGLAGTGGAADDAVHDDHRGTETTEVDFGSESTRLAAVLGDQEARNLTLEGGDTVGRLGGGDVLGADLGDGAGEGFTFLDAVTDDHGLVEEFGILDEDHIHGRGSLEDAGLETDGGELEDCAFGHDEGKVAVHIGGRAHSRSLLQDGCPDDRLLLRIRDRTGHRDVLGAEHRHAEKDSGECGCHALEQV